MLDVNNFKTLRKYLVDNGLALSSTAIQIQHLPGGVSNSVLKIAAGDDRFVLKQALAKLKVASEWLSDVERSNVEKQALKFLHKITPGFAPELVYEDEENYLLIMQCAPENSVTWKSLLMQRDCNERVAYNVGEVLGRLHAATHDLQEAKERFGNKKFYHQLRIAPFFDFLKTSHPSLQKEIDRHIEQSLSREWSLVIGDYSPKNILVHNQDLTIIDFEVVHYGDTSFDLGFLTAHLSLKAIVGGPYRRNYQRVLQQAVEGYFTHINFLDRTLLEQLAVQQLGWILLARVDGKSPAEYISTVEEKQFIRQVAYEILRNNMKTYSEVIDFLNLKMR